MQPCLVGWKPCLRCRSSCVLVSHPTKPRCMQYDLLWPKPSTGSQLFILERRAIRSSGQGSCVVWVLKEREPTPCCIWPVHPLSLTLKHGVWCRRCGMLGRLGGLTRLRPCCPCLPQLIWTCLPMDQQRRCCLDCGGWDGQLLPTVWFRIDTARLASLRLVGMSCTLGSHFLGAMFWAVKLHTVPLFKALTWQMFKRCKQPWPSLGRPTKCSWDVISMGHCTHKTAEPIFKMMLVANALVRTERWILPQGLDLPLLCRSSHPHDSATACLNFHSACLFVMSWLGSHLAGMGGLCRVVGAGPWIFFHVTNQSVPVE